MLGAGSILPRVGYGCSGYALCPADTEEVTLLDCGPGSVRALATAGVDLRAVRRVVLSHFHLDHCLDVFALAFARRNPGLRPVPPLELIGPVGLRRFVRGAAEGLGRWSVDPDVTLLEVEPRSSGRVTHEVGGLLLSATATGHTPEAVAWRVDLRGGGSLAYTGDSGPNPAVARLAQGVDLFVVECSFPDDQAVPNHLTPTGAGEMAQAAGARRLLLTHFYPEMDPREARAGAAQVYSGSIELARDGSVHGLP